VRVLLQSPPLCLPLIILWRLGPEAAAHFIPAVVALRALMLVPAAFGNVLFASASRLPEQVVLLARRSLRSLLVVATVATALAVALMPVLGMVLGPAYTGPGIDAARCAVLSTVAWSATYLYVSIHRAVGRALHAVAAAVLCTTLSLVGACLFSGGIAGVATGFVVGSYGAALAVTPFLSRLITRLSAREAGR